MSAGTHKLLTDLPEWQQLQSHYNKVKDLHLKDLLQDSSRNSLLTCESNDIYIDYSRQRVTPDTIQLLYKLADACNIKQKIHAMSSGEHINISENRAVGHIALRAASNDKFMIDGHNVVPDVQNVLNKIKSYTNDVRSGRILGSTGKQLTDVIAVGIGGSYLGAQFVYEALYSDSTASTAAHGRRLHFLANVDPVAVSRALLDFDAETTLVVVISKTFTTRETMLNASTIKQWIIDSLQNESAVEKHMICCSTNEKEYTKFGIKKENAFEFWDWVGGRYSVCSAVGLVPLSLHYGYDVIQQFLDGARSIDQNFITADYRSNLPITLGLLGVWNNNFYNYHTRALICYSEAMNKLAPHIQQVDMESNGKWVTVDGVPCPYSTGMITFGEPGTNSQHSFFQLIHQGNNIVPVDFIGFIESQYNVKLTNEHITSHEELMCNYFAQPDALATGKTIDEYKSEGEKSDLVAKHRMMPGNKPSTSILLQKLSAYQVGQLLALFEHRTAVEGFIWNIDSFDQWGVELGKKLASNVRVSITNARSNNTTNTNGYNSSTSELLKRFLSNKNAHTGTAHFK